MMEAIFSGYGDLAQNFQNALFKTFQL